MQKYENKPAGLHPPQLKKLLHEMQFARKGKAGRAQG